MAGEPDVNEIVDVMDTRKKTTNARYKKYAGSGPWGINSLLEDKIPVK